MDKNQSIKLIRSIFNMLSPPDEISLGGDSVFHDLSRFMRNYVRDRNEKFDAKINNIVCAFDDFIRNKSYQVELECIELVNPNEAISPANAETLREVRLTLSNGCSSESGKLEVWRIGMTTKNNDKLDLDWSTLTLSSNSGRHYSFVDEAKNPHIKPQKALLDGLATAIPFELKLHESLQQRVQDLNDKFVGSKLKQINANNFYGQNSLFTRYFEEVIAAGGYSQKPLEPPLSDETKYCIAKILNKDLFIVTQNMMTPSFAEKVHPDLYPIIVAGILKEPSGTDQKRDYSVNFLNWIRENYLPVGESLVDNYPIDHNLWFNENRAFMAKDKAVVSAYLKNGSMAAVEDHLAIMHTLGGRLDNMPDDVKAVYQSHLLAAEEMPKKRQFAKL